MGDYEKDFELQLEVLAQIDALRKERSDLLTTRQANLPGSPALKAARLEHENSKKQALKSDLKKSNAFVKRLKAITTDGIQQCLRETESLNLSLFISEIVAAILSVPFKATDVSIMVKLAVILHRRYEEFCDGLCAGIKSSLLGPLPSLEEDPDAGKKKRIQIRFVIELYQAGLFTDEEFFCQLLRNILGKSRMKYGNNL
eukprot:gene24460-31851_t